MMTLNSIIERIEAKLDKMQDDVSEMKIDISRNTSDVAHHIKRSDLTDEQVKLLQKRIERVEATDNRINWTIKVIIGLAGIATFLHEMGII